MQRLMKTYLRHNETVILPIKQINRDGNFAEIVRWRPELSIAKIVAQEPIIIRNEGGT